ncbi:MAG: aspartate--tRNA(Asn) ligase [Anaerolineae bacterium]|nr:aspartate--tRNA(Asn) ligase [Anaerolineae bacterium]
MKRTLATHLSQHIGERVCLQGWLHALRKMGDVNFLILRDRSGIVQAVTSADDLDALQGLHNESVIQIEGEVVPSPKAPGGFELYHNHITVITSVTTPPPFSLNKNRIKANQPAFLDHAVIGHRHLKNRAILRLLSGVMQGFRQSLDTRDFVEIQTPKLVASATESGANVFAVDYFGQMAYLAQSPQFYKQIMVGVFERVYEVGPVFRAEKHATRRHINEYVSLDVEFGFIEDHFTVMALLTEVVRDILAHLEAHYAGDLLTLAASLPRLNATIPHIHIAEAQQLLADQHGVTDALGEPDLTPEHERLLGEWAAQTHASDFLFVTGYPMSKRPFYTHPDPARPGYSNSFDLLFRGTELVTGGQRLHRYEDYLAAAEQYGYPLEPFETYFEAFKHGMPPHGGFAIGLERFLMQLLDLDNIRLATLFPRDMNRLTP